MKIRLTVVLDDDDRRAMNHHYGLPGKAKRELCESWATAAVRNTIQLVRSEYDHDPDVRKRRARKLNKLGPGLGMVRG
jgi:hypothetical protein